MADNPYDALFSGYKKAAPVNPMDAPGGTPGPVGGVAAPQVLSGLSNLLAWPNTPGAMLGATLRDVAHGRKIGGDQPRGSRTAQSHFMEGLGKSPASAVNEYFATSPQSMHEYRTGSNPVLRSIGEYFAHHPKQGAALDFVGRILDPGNALTLDATSVANAALKGTVRAGARKAAAKIIEHAPEAAGSPIVRVLRSAENRGQFNRFGEVKSAASDIARSRGWNPTQVADHGEAAESAARDLANSGKYAKSAAQRAVNSVGKGLTKGEQFDLLNMIEGDSPLMGSVEKLSPAQRAVRDKLLPRVTKYRQIRAGLDTASQRYQVADASRFLRGDNFFSRAGMYVDPSNELGEEALPENEAFRQQFRAGSGGGPRKGTLGENVHRKYPTHAAAMRAGVQLRPDVTPMDALEMHVYARVQAARINEQLNKLQDLGLIVPKEEPVPFAVGVTRPVPQPAGYTDFSQLGSMRTFGSNVTRNAWVHPAVPSLIEDVAATRASREGVSSLMNLVGAAGRVANHVLSAAEVSDPAWHPAFNIDQNIASEAPNLRKLIAGASSNRAVERAEEEGVHVPFARRQNAAEWSRPWSDLTPREKALRLIRSVPHGVESFSAAPLYGHVEPRMATGAYEGLKDRMGAAGAKNVVRGMLGEPENISAAQSDVASLAQFPAWTLSQLRRWPGAVARRPALYNAPHAAIRDLNLAKGRGDRPGDEGKMLPPIVLGRDKNGDFNVLNIPHPGNRASELGTAVLKGDEQGIKYALAGAANPLLQGPLYKQLQLDGQQQRDLAFVAPKESPLGAVGDYFKGFGSFSPIRSLTRTELTPEHAQAQKYLLNAFLYNPGRGDTGLVELRALQHKAERNGNTAEATRLRAAADAMYGRMVKALTSQGFPSP